MKKGKGATTIKTTEDFNLSDLRQFLTTLMMENPKGMTKRAVEKALQEQLPHHFLDKSRITKVINSIASYRSPGKYILTAEVKAAFAKSSSGSRTSQETAPAHSSSLDCVAAFMEKPSGEQKGEKRKTALTFGSNEDSCVALHQGPKSTQGTSPKSFLSLEGGESEASMTIRRTRETIGGKENAEKQHLYWLNISMRTGECSELKIQKQICEGFTTGQEMANADHMSEGVDESLAKQSKNEGRLRGLEENADQPPENSGSPPLIEADHSKYIAGNDSSNSSDSDDDSDSDNDVEDASESKRGSDINSDEDSETKSGSGSDSESGSGSDIDTDDDGNIVRNDEVDMDVVMAESSVGDGGEGGETKKLLNQEVTEEGPKGSNTKEEVDIISCGDTPSFGGIMASPVDFGEDSASALEGKLPEFMEEASHHCSNEDDLPHRAGTDSELSKDIQTRKCLQSDGVSWLKSPQIIDPPSRIGSDILVSAVAMHQSEQLNLDNCIFQSPQHTKQASRTHALMGSEVSRPGSTGPSCRKGGSLPGGLSHNFVACLEMGLESKEDGKRTIKLNLVGGDSTSGMIQQVDKKTRKRPSRWDAPAKVENLRHPSDFFSASQTSSTSFQALKQAVGPPVPQPVWHFSASNSFQVFPKIQNSAMSRQLQMQFQCPPVMGARCPGSRPHHPHTQYLQGIPPPQQIRGAPPMQMQPLWISARPPWTSGELKDKGLPEGQKLVAPHDERLEMGNNYPVEALKSFGDHQGSQCFRPPGRNGNFLENSRKHSRNVLSKFSREPGLLGKGSTIRETTRVDHLLTSSQDALRGHESVGGHKEGFKTGDNPALKALEDHLAGRSSKRLAEDRGNYDLGRPSKRIASENSQEATSLGREDPASYRPKKTRSVLDTAANTSGVDVSMGFLRDGGNQLGGKGSRARGANGLALSLKIKGGKAIGSKHVDKRLFVPDGKKKTKAGLLGSGFLDNEPCNAKSQEFFAPYEKTAAELKGPILHHDQYMEYCKEYREKYRVYGYLKISLKSDKEDFEKFSRDITLAEATGDKNKVELLYGAVREAYKLSSKRFKRMQKTFFLLHDELKVIKQHCKEFAEKRVQGSHK